MTSSIRRRLAAPTAALRHDERGSLSMALLVCMMFIVLAFTLVTSTISLNAGVRAGDQRTHSQELLASMRSQIIGGLNAGSVDYTSTVPVSGCTSGTVYGLVLPTSTCASVTFAAPTADNEASTGNLSLGVSLETWQHMVNSTGRLADVKSSFQAYGTCVVGYVAGTGTDVNPVQYSPCSSTTKTSAKHFIWVGRDSAPAVAPTSTAAATPSPSPTTTAPPAPPSAPTGLTVAPSQGASGTLAISWNAAGTAASYRVLYSTSSTVPDTSTSVTSTTTTTTLTALSANTTYFVKVIAVNTGGSGPASAIVSDKTSPALVASLTYTKPAGSTPGSATWPAVTGATGYYLVATTATSCNGVAVATSTTPSTTATTLTGTRTGTTLCVFATSRSAAPYYYGTPAATTIG